MEQKTSALEQVAYGAIIAAEVFVLLDQNDRRSGGPGLLERFTRLKKKYLKPWHFPERWRRMVNEVLVEAWIATEEDDEDDQPR